MDTLSSDSMIIELRGFLDETVALTRAVANDDTAWTTPWAGSPAGTELAAEEKRHPYPGTGSWPWRAAPMFARWALQVAASAASGFAAVLGRDETSYAADVLCRGILESSSLSWWLLDPDIGSERRLARSLVYRLHTAGETDRAVRALELGPDDYPADYGESADGVREEIRALGLACTKSGTVSFGDDGTSTESWPGYTERTAQLAERIWPQRKLPYALLSAVAHAEFLGLQRSLPELAGHASDLRPTTGPADAALWLWLWQDAYLVLGALIFSADRAAAFLGLPDQLAALNVLTGRLDERLLALRPAMPDGP
jgi:hypothetical protein